jgi:hypothetical protein
VTHTQQRCLLYELPLQAGAACQLLQITDSHSYLQRTRRLLHSPARPPLDPASARATAAAAVASWRLLCVSWWPGNAQNAQSRAPACAGDCCDTVHVAASPLLHAETALLPHCCCCCCCHC